MGVKQVLLLQLFLGTVGVETYTYFTVPEWMLGQEYALMIAMALQVIAFIVWLKSESDG